jgi:acetolactate synthase I/II/III large subunit
MKGDNDWQRIPAVLTDRLVVRRGKPLNGAEALVATAISGGVEICFANPGTTELPLVLALDSVPGLRSILCLDENVATGAADGYGRMAAKPAMCLLHLGQGLADGLTNLHNARALSRRC